MNAPPVRLRDSWLIRIGSGIIAAVFTIVLAFALAFKMWNYNPPVGPAGLWAFFWIIAGFLFIVVGIGQTLVRRRRRGES